MAAVGIVTDADRVIAPFSHCSYCGHRFRRGAGWPRRCGSCGHVSYRNPIPVVVLAAAGRIKVE